MSTDIKTQYRFRGLTQLIRDFQEGMIQVPTYHRGFVWDLQQRLRLLDSIKNGYPIGMFILCYDYSEAYDLGHFSAHSKQKIGGYFIKEKSPGFYYILDGYQRIATLIGCLLHPFRAGFERDEREWMDKFNIVYNLQNERFEYSQEKDPSEIHIIPVYKLLDGKSFYEFRQKLESSDLVLDRKFKYIKQYEDLSARFVECQIPCMEIAGGQREQLIEIFSRINLPATKVNDVWKASALSLNPQKHFSLEEEIEQLRKELSRYYFSGLDKRVVLRCVINSFIGDLHKSADLRLSADLALRSEFVEVARNTFDGIIRAVQFLFDELYVVNLNQLPYEEQFVYITNRFVTGTGNGERQQDELVNWFWKTSYSEEFKKTKHKKFHAGIVPVTTVHFPGQLEMKTSRQKVLILFMLKHAAVPYSQIRQSYREFFLSPDIENLYQAENVIVGLGEDWQGGHSANTFILSDLMNSDLDLTRYFITADMKDQYLRNKDHLALLNARKQEIINAESEFVTQLGLTYQAT